MGFRVRYNHLGAVAKAMPKELDDGVDEASDSLTRELKASVWIDTGMIKRVTSDRELGPLRAQVSVGWYLGHGFYSGFQEFGVASRGIAPRPIVAPAAHRMERQYHLEMAQKVRDACNKT